MAFCAPSASSRFRSLSSMSISAFMLRVGGVEAVERAETGGWGEVHSGLRASRRALMSCRRLSMSRDMASVLRSGCGGEWGTSLPRGDLCGRMRGMWAPRADV